MALVHTHIQARTAALSTFSRMNLELPALAIVSYFLAVGRGTAEEDCADMADPPLGADPPRPRPDPRCWCAPLPPLPGLSR
jgi:hypothetical protein